MPFLLIAYFYKQSTFSFTHYDDTLLYHELFDEDLSLPGLTYVRG